MAERFFNKIADDVEVATRQLQSLMFGPDDSETTDGSTSGGGGGSTGPGGPESSGSFTHEFDMSDIDIDSMSEEEIQRVLGEEMMRNNPLQDMANDVTKNIMAGQIQPQTPREHFDAFRSAIRWSENFIAGLICFHIFVFLLCLFVSKKNSGLAPRVGLMVFIGVVVRSAEWLNSLGDEHWESFATQNYFDNRGVFIGIMLCAPLLLDSLMMLLFFMKEASTLLVQVKRTEIQRKRKSASNGDRKKKKSGSRPKTKKQD
mmetsp:Transcript_24222/g.57159  ORF Transcript_24222/g.57159 Transcript_24222/m.57159 type:complete len:259 (-) Transcript_24222:249-1025(-)